MASHVHSLVKIVTDFMPRSLVQAPMLRLHTRC